MKALNSNIDTQSNSFTDNAQQMKSLVEQLNGYLQISREQGSEKQV